MKIKTIGVLLGLLCVTGALWAHDVWLVPKEGHLELLYGHETPEPYDPAKIKEANAYDKSGTSVAIKRLKLDQAFGITPNPEAAMVTVVFDNGFWVEASSTEWKNVGKDEAKKAANYSHPWKFHKSLYAWSPRFVEPFGLKFEIVPLQNPFTRKAGDILPIRVLFDGKPLPGADVEYGLHGDKAPKVKSDDKGLASVPITRGPEQFIAVDYKLPAGEDKEADHISYATSLRYELK
jgi:nickel transport protein